MANNRLTRDKDQAMLGGVCAGIANRLGLDPTIVRVATIALAIVSAAVPVGVIYLALWIIMPAAEATPHRPSRDELTAELREAADRVQEAAKIAAAAARQAADEIAAMQSRRRSADAGTPEAGAVDVGGADATTTDAGTSAGATGDGGEAGGTAEAGGAAEAGGTGNAGGAGATGDASPADAPSADNDTEGAPPPPTPPAQL